MYNDMVIMEQYGTAPMRAGIQFRGGRKVVKVHQNVLVFYKGNMKEIKNIYCNELKFADLERFKENNASD